MGLIIAKKEKTFFKLIFFNISLFVVIFYLVKIITPHYCIIHKSESEPTKGFGGLEGLLGRSYSYCDWEYLINSNEQIIFTIALFVFVLFIVNSIKKYHERKN